MKKKILNLSIVSSILIPISITIGCSSSTTKNNEDIQSIKKIFDKFEEKNSFDFNSFEKLNSYTTLTTTENINNETTKITGQSLVLKTKNEINESKIFSAPKNGSVTPISYIPKGSTIRITHEKFAKHGNGNHNYYSAFYAEGEINGTKTGWDIDDDLDEPLLIGFAKLFSKTQLSNDYLKFVVTELNTITKGDILPSNTLDPLAIEATLYGRNLEPFSGVLINKKDGSTTFNTGDTAVLALNVKDDYYTLPSNFDTNTLKKEFIV